MTDDEVGYRVTSKGLDYIVDHRLLGESAFMVHACHAYPRLVAALRGMIEAYQHEASMENPALIAARDAIEYADGYRAP